MKESENNALPPIKQKSSTDVIDQLVNKSFAREKRMGFLHKLPNEKDLISILKNTPTKNIFLSFVSGFLQRKTQKPRAKTFRLVVKTGRMENNAAEMESSRKEKLFNIVSPKTESVLLKKPIKSPRRLFPHLQPSSSLQEFLVKERTKLEASQSERLLKLRAFSKKENIRTKLQKKKKKSENKKKSKKKHTKPSKSILI